MPRAIWKGAITFGLVHVPVALYPASEESEIDFDWLDKRSMDPVGYKRINKRTGREIAKGNIVRGIKHHNGEYVLLSDEEIKAAYPKTTQTIEIESFVSAEEIPFVFLERPYYLAPIEKGEKVYALLREAMLQKKVVGVARVVMHTKEHLAALIPEGRALLLNTLRWSDEIRSTDGLTLPAGKAAPKFSGNELKMAGRLIQQLTTAWKPERYAEKFTEAVKHLVARRVKAGKTHAVEPLEPANPLLPSNVVDLTELLENSLGKRTARSDRSSAKSRRRAATGTRRNVPKVRKAPSRLDPDPLERYRGKRDFEVTPEPKPARGGRVEHLSFVIQKHAATRLHYDLRLELDGVLLSWAVPKGPSLDPVQKRMAIHVEDHPVSYGSFEGTIPLKQYGAGKVIVWDRGIWEPVGDPRLGMAKGKLEFRLHGQKLAGLWELIRIRNPREQRQEPWLLFKKRDEWARPLAQYDVTTALPDSVLAKPLGQLEDRAGRTAKPAGISTVKRVSLDALTGAVKSKSPPKLAPQLATLSKILPSGGDWLYEIKFDGYRIMARVEGGRVRFITRGGHDWTSKMAPLVSAVEGLGLRSAWLDGEIVVLNEDGTPNFNALQNAFDSARTESIRYFVFDVPYFDGYDLRAVPLRDRRALLKQLLERNTREEVRFSVDFTGDAEKVLRSACELKLEGVIAKRADAPYVSARTSAWLKLKCSEQQEFVIAGYTDRTGTTSEVGSLLLGVYRDDGKLVSAGGVGTGWSSEMGRQLKTRLQKLEVSKSPFDSAGSQKKGRWSKRSAGAERWVKPLLVAQVSFGGWTPDGSIRHASFQGLRIDKPAKAVVREQAGTAAPPKQPNGARTSIIGGLKISHPDRVIDASSGSTKLDLVRYYESVADWILPHLAARPVTLVRGPTGVGGEVFFQKHGEKLRIPGIHQLHPRLWPGHEALLEISSAEGVVGAAQMNVIEFHTWNSTAQKIDKPDRIVFDLDPGKGVRWAQLQEAALLTRTILTELELESWLKTSGGKGLHIVVPLAPRLDYESVKGFSQAVVQHLAKTIPSRFVAKSGPANRIGKIFVDYIRNGHGATTAAAFSARARPGLGVSMPISWDQLSSVESGAHWTIANAREYLSFQTVDPWGEYWKTRPTLTRPMKALGCKPARTPRSR